jgi:hypothetical protein
MLRVRKLLEELVDWAEGERPLDIVVQGVEQGRGLMMKRVFNSEQGAKDVTGQGLGKYSNSYAQRRQGMGLQAKVIDLTYTESLFRDVKTVRNAEKITIAIQSQENREKVGFIENRYKKNIFDLSKSEREVVLKTIKLNLDKDFEEIVASYL